MATDPNFFKTYVQRQPIRETVLGGDLLVLVDSGGQQAYRTNVQAVGAYVVSVLPPVEADVLCDAAGGVANHKINVTIGSDGAVITMTLHPGGASPTLVRLAEGWRDLLPDTTTTIPEGTELSPLTSRVWLTWDAGGELVEVNVGADWPAGEHVQVAEVTVMTAALVQSDPVRGIVHVAESDAHYCNGGNGLDAVLPAAIRSLPARWEDGGEVTVNAVGAALLGIAVTATTVTRVRRATADAIAGPGRFWLPFGGWGGYTDLVDVAETAGGNPIGVNDYASFVVGLAVGDDGAGDHLWITQPTGTYGAEEAAIADPGRTADTRIPEVWRGSGVLLARVVIKRQAPGAPEDYVVAYLQDLRGLAPGAPASQAAGAAPGVYSDSAFALFAASAPALVLSYDLSGMVSSGTVAVPELPIGSIMGVRVPITAISGPGQPGHWTSDATGLYVWEPTAAGGAGGWLKAALTPA
jgi:hypothetical protein